MNKNIFCQWIGRTAIKDLLFPNASDAKPPAIIEAHKKFHFDEVILLGNIDIDKPDTLILDGQTKTFNLYTYDVLKRYEDTVKKQCNCKTQLHTITEGATDLISIYQKTNTILKTCSHLTTMYYDTNSGTTAMTVNWYFLWSKYGGHLLETKLPKHTRQKQNIIVREMQVPFKIVAEFIPEQAIENFLKEDIIESKEFQQILGQSKDLIKVKMLAQKIAPFSPNVIIQGESGTGKELFASALHNAIQTAKGGKDIPFVTINCGAIPHNLIEAELFGVEKGAFTGADKQRKGVFQRANGGVLFLDEIGDLPLEAQVKLLRAIPTSSKDGEVYKVGASKADNVKLNIIAATHKDLPKLISQGKFREDLFYRLATIVLHIPPLRDREEDIELLANHLLQTWCAKYKLKKTLTEAAKSALRSHRWSGNIRELENTIKHLLITTEKEIVTEVDVKKALSHFGTLQDGIQIEMWPLDKFAEAKEEFERQFILRALSQTSNNITKAAQRMKLERRTLQNRMEKLGIVIKTIIQ